MRKISYFMFALIVFIFGFSVNVFADEYISADGSYEYYNESIPINFTAYDHGNWNIQITNLTYQRNGDLINSSSYNLNVVSGAANWGRGNRLNTTVIYKGHNHIIRQNGTIEYINTCIENVSAMQGYRFLVYRPNSAYTAYTLVYASPELKPQLSNGVNRIYIGDAVVQEGDCVGESINGTGLSTDTYYSVYAAATGSCIYVYNQSISDFTSFTTTGVTHPIIVEMRAPNAVSIGDSITAGHPGHYSFIESTATTNTLSNYEHYLIGSSGMSVENMGIGSQRTDQIEDRFYTDAIMHHPKYIFIEGTVNSVAAMATNTSVTNESILSDWESMLDMCDAAGIEPIVILSTPWTNGNTSQRNTLQYLNTQLETKASEHSALCINLTSVMGTYDGVTGTWYMKTEYNADGVHPNTAGYQAMGNEIYRQFSSITVNGENYTSGTEIEIEDISAINILSNIEYSNADILVSYNYSPTGSVNVRQFGLFGIIGMIELLPIVILITLAGGILRRNETDIKHIVYAVSASVLITILGITTLIIISCMQGI